jgi:hypothetical protein
MLRNVSAGFKHELDMAKIKKPVHERTSADYDLWDWIKVTSMLCIDEATGCWNYTRRLNKGGYGYATTSKFGSIQDKYIHRIMYRFLIGPIPDGFHIDHLCRNRACGNPLHMEPVTAAVNVMRGLGPCAQNASKTHCSKGHQLEGHNLIWKKRPGRKLYRTCRMCIYARNKVAYLTKDGRAKQNARYHKRKAKLAQSNP